MANSRLTERREDYGPEVVRYLGESESINVSQGTVFLVEKAEPGQPIKRVLASVIGFNGENTLFEVGIGNVRKRKIITVPTDETERVRKIREFRIMGEVLDPAKFVTQERARPKKLPDQLPPKGVYLALFGLFLPTSDVRDISKLYGRGGMNVLLRADTEPRGKRNYDFDPKKINVRFLRASPLVYGYNDKKISAEMFYAMQMDAAIGGVEHLDRMVSLPGRLIGIHNDVKIYFNDPAEPLRTINEKGRDELLTFELIRGLLLAHIAGRINARDFQDNERDTLAGLQRLFTDKLFRGHGEAKPKDVRTIHYPDTNTVKSVTFGNETPPGRWLVKTHHPSLRWSKAAECFVYTYVRRKGVAESVLKALYNLSKTGGFLDPLKAVRDRIGIMNVVYGTNEQAEAFRAAQEAILDGERIKHKRADKFDDDHGQAPTYRARRVMVKPVGMDSDGELQTVTAEEHYNNQYEVGRKIPPTLVIPGGCYPGTYSGRAHSEFMLRRAAPVAEVIFPAGYYPDANIPGRVNTKADVLAHQLRLENTTEGFEYIRHSFHP